MTSSSRDSVRMQVSIEEPNRIRFSGKGAGAGMMLSSAMGPMGMAIGVAIDEGIAKDIQEGMRETGFSAQRSLQAAISEQCAAAGQSVTFVDNGGDKRVVLERYGFSMVPAGQDQAGATVALGVTSLTEPGVHERYYQSDLKAIKLTADLETVKQGGWRAVRLLQQEMSVAVSTVDVCGL